MTTIIQIIKTLQNSIKKLEISTVLRMSHVKKTKRQAQKGQLKQLQVDSGKRVYLEDPRRMFLIHLQKKLENQSEEEVIMQLMLEAQ